MMVALAQSFPLPNSRDVAFRQGCTTAAALSRRLLFPKRPETSKTGARSLPSMHAVSEVSVRQSRSECGQLSDERSDVAGRVVAYLRRRHPLKTAECVSADLRVKSFTVQKWIDRYSAPSACMLLRMINFYGPEFLACVMGDHAPSWLRKDAHEARRAEIEKRMADLQAELETL